MRKAFIEVDTREQAIKLAPWACKVVKADGGYHAFECVNDYRVWKNQK